jgi:two-component system, OmpR family, sensor histidine kinase KdpD
MASGEETRPKPEQLLARLRKEEQIAAEGKLKIFLGAAPGVGKTYSMLEDAQALLKEKVDVVAGYVVTHGRLETENMLVGLERTPEKVIEYRNTTFKEFDLDKALERRPGLILIDELAHTNVPGSRHEKRWQDVEELLSAGINVHATLNIQHLESANDVVAQITGVRVQETVPDSVFEKAYEVELVDLPPDELIQRLEEGKVYIAEFSQIALKNFFRKGNLIALRELALRSLAERIDAQVQEYRREESVHETWPIGESIIVCVGTGPLSLRLVRSSKRMATRLRADWIAVSVETPRYARLPQRDRDRVVKTLQLAERLGGETAILTGTNVSDELVEFARARNATRIVIGKPARPRWHEILFGSVVEDVIRKSGDIDVYVMTGERAHFDQTGIQSPIKRVEWKGYFFASGIVVIATVLVKLTLTKLDAVNLVMIYQLAVVLTAIRYGRGPSALSAILGVGAFDFFCVPPYYSFAVTDTQYFITFMVMLVVGLLLSNLTSTIRQQAFSARQRERRTAALYSMSREQATAMTKDQVIRTSVKHIAEVFDCKVAAWIPDKNGNLESVKDLPSAFDADSKEMGVAQWVYINRRMAGKSTSTLPGARAMYVPLAGIGGTIGVVGLLSSDDGRFANPDDLHLLEMFANQMALAVERAMLTEPIGGAVKTPQKSRETQP